LRSIQIGQNSEFHFSICMRKSSFSLLLYLLS
jgi:hypothetical protein